MTWKGLTNSGFLWIISVDQQGGRTHGETLFTTALERPAAN